jgi:hypothetical protein
MMNRSTFVRAILAAGVLALGVAGCGQLRPSEKMEIFEATLTGAQEVPPVATSATGQAELFFNSNTNRLRWKVTHSGLSAPPTGGHIHGPAGPGANAGIVIPFTGNLAGTIEGGEIQLNPQQVNELMSGMWYVNIHTARYPAGEIRGQLRPRR